MNYIIKNYIEISQFFIGVFLFISSIEWSYLYFDKSLRPFFDKFSVILRLQDSGILKIKKAEHLKESYNSYILKTLIFLKFIFGLLLIINLFLPFGYSLSVVSVFSLIILLMFGALYGFGFEGSDQMAYIILFSISVVCLYPENKLIIQYFVTIQLMLSYFVAGVSKLVSSHWRKGDALIMVLSTKSFGFGNANWLKNNKKTTQMLSILIILFEISWVFLPVGNVAMYLIPLGILFHISNSIIMGLNLFTWSFLAAYPWAFYLIFA